MQFLADVQLVCAVCHGKRFLPEVLAVHHGGKSVADVLAMTVTEALAFFDMPKARDYVIARTLQPVIDVGLGYLPLGQPLSTLSGGEAQRLKLARALSEKASRALFVLDEPSAGLHALDAAQVIAALGRLADDGASVIVVEHDLDVVRSADWVIDLGPDAGPLGGHVVAQGTPRDVAKTKTRTGIALSSRGAPRLDPRPSRPAILSAPRIVIEHAREHNLKDVSCNIPHGTLCVVTGPSGSGKSSLAFDVVFAEGQRRFMETLTPYARQFLPTLPRPDVDRVTGVPPSIALEQRTTRAGANSTVATVTEIAHYMRLLYAKVGVMHCPKCDAAVRPSSPDELFARLVSSTETGKHTIYSAAVRARKGTYLDLFNEAARAGIKAARVDGAIVVTDPPPKLKKSVEHDVDLDRSLRCARHARPSDLRSSPRVGARHAEARERIPQGPPERRRAHRVDRTCLQRVRYRRSRGRPALVLFQHQTRSVRGVPRDGRGLARGRRDVSHVQRDAARPDSTRRPAVRRDVPAPSLA